MSSWNWRTSTACDLDELLDDLNPQMKSLEGSLGTVIRPSVMSGYPNAVGAIVSNTTVTAPADTNENTLKSTNLGRGAISSKGGWRLTATGTCSGSAAGKTIKVYWGGIAVATLTIGTGTVHWRIELCAWNRDTTQTQIISAKCYDGATLDVMQQAQEDVDTG